MNTTVNEPVCTGTAEGRSVFLLMVFLLLLVALLSVRSALY